ncbi:hypothetical protein CHT98_23320 (plasmid) [Azospirillum brasilense]|uniref:Uncharacterized protein n=1 Tax=Azospirillum brasilense TaxID=192 RepID=A0A235H906_AZOBR|nr:hypothetical protein CHT98_23320 [Azospirillum brasilense]
MNHESFFIENVTRTNCQRNGIFECLFPLPRERVPAKRTGEGHTEDQGSPSWRQPHPSRAGHESLPSPETEEGHTDAVATPNGEGRDGANRSLD